MTFKEAKQLIETLRLTDDEIDFFNRVIQRTERIEFFTAEHLTEEQWLNYIYWLQEDRDLRGVPELCQRAKTPKGKIFNIRSSVADFLSKYPDGILTGWSMPSTTREE